MGAEESRWDCPGVGDTSFIIAAVDMLIAKVTVEYAEIDCAVCQDAMTDDRELEEPSSQLWLSWLILIVYHHIITMVAAGHTYS